ncbi:uncharacterized protein LOC126281753 [Schistocerca gregaria]|uniref:uncharacterized protein LOC126281753 n=1 Tax=Schistocerca gregaria TaxID=7010 RepID=UPI00211EF0C5|nr:uncharacterized protein LOC126281753 [Schistocerca gregaria]
MAVSAGRSASAATRVLLLALSWSGAVSGASGGAADSLEDPTWSPLAVAHCRATCLRQFLPTNGKDSSCKLHRDCFMCWENCELLQSDWSVWGSMCSEQSVCFPGCRQACRFFRGGQGVGGGSGPAPPPQQQTPVAQTRALPRLAVAGRDLFWPCRLPRNATGPRAAPGAARLVYVVVWRPDDASHWRQVTQTEQCGARVPSASGSARVLAVDAGGLRTVYTPAWAAPAASLGPVAARDLAGASMRHPTPAGPSTATGDGSVWSVEVLSVIHQGVLVIAELSWRAPDKDLLAARRDGGSPLYLVTWEVDGGGITGNLYTDSSCVTLSLWPDTVFHIRVELMWHSRSLSHSEPLRLDTSGVSAPAVRRELSAPEAAPASGRPAPPPPPPPARGQWPALPWASLYALVALTLLALVTPALYLLADCASRACRRTSAPADDKWSLIGHEEAGVHTTDLPDSRQHILQETLHESKRPLEVQA